jgi:PA14 domain
MHKSLICFSFIAVTTAVAACEVDVNSNGHPHHPQGQLPPPPPPANPANATPAMGPAGGTPAPAPTPAPVAPVNRFAQRGAIHKPAIAGAGFTGLGAQPQPAPGTPGQPPIMSGTNVFGNGNADTAQTGFTGTLFWIPAGTAQMPAYTGMQPAGFLFSPTLNVANQAMNGGFPGIDPNHNQWFGIEWEAPLVVGTESDYSFHVSSDDGTVVKIDGTVIVNNDHANLKDASGPVHLVKGTHDLVVDYYQATANVALQLFCTKAGSSEQICPAQLP